MTEILPARMASGPRPGTVLIVADEARLQRILRDNLRSGQYAIVAARTGREALALAASERPDAIIVDLSLPDADGVDVIVELRRRHRVPIIVLSGRVGRGRSSSSCSNARASWWARRS